MTYFDSFKAEFKRSQFAYVSMLIFYAAFCVFSDQARKEPIKLLLIIVTIAVITLGVRAWGSYKKSNR